MSTRLRRAGGVNPPVQHTLRRAGGVNPPVQHTVPDTATNRGVHTPRPPQIVVAVAALCLLAAGCRQEMSAQPKYKPLQHSDFFGDGRSARPLEEGTVARGQLRDDPAFYEGVLSSEDAVPLVGLVGLVGGPGAVASLKPGAKFESSVMPFEVTEKDMEIGRERYNIYCSVCHDRVGTGHGKVVERGYLRPPSYHSARLRAAPVGHFYQVITNGYGGMPDYREQIPPRDRWRIVAYVRALQLSQNPGEKP
jgi:hypothetical protein